MDMAGAEETLLVCEDSIEGVFSGIYEAYSRRLPRERTRIQAGEEENLRLFAVYEQVTQNPEHAAKVSRTLRREFGEEDYGSLCYALASRDGEKAQAVYRTVAEGLRMRGAGKQNRIMEHLSNPYVRKVMELSRTTGNETHFLKEFLRFQEMEQGILFAQIGPKNKVLPFLVPHFADRLPMENFVIYDATHDLAALHPSGKEWYLARDFGNAYREAGLACTDGERYFQELFRHFCHKITIEERRNLDLQRNMLPLHFRKYMTEFQPK